MSKMKSLKEYMLVKFSVVSFVICLGLAVGISELLSTRLNHNIELMKAHSAAMMAGKMIKETNPFSIPSLTKNVRNLQWIIYASVGGSFILLYAGLILWRAVIRQKSILANANMDLLSANKRLNMLHETSVAVTSTLELRAVLDILVEKMGHLLAYSAVFVWLLNRETGLLERKTSWNINEEEWKGRQSKNTPILVKSAFDSKAPVVATDVRTDPRMRDPEFYIRHGMISFLGLPLLANNEAIGVMSFFTKDEHEFSEEEIGLLSTLTGQAAIAVKNAQLFKQTIKQAEELEQDIIRRKRVEIRLKTLADQLKRSNDELQDFASVASHDLQEPLRKIRAFGDRLKIKCGDSLNEEGGDYIDRMQHAAGRMQTLINDMLTFSRVTTKAKPFVPVDLAEVTREVLSDLEVRIMQTAGQVEVGDLPTIDADPLQMRQLIQNLVANALKFHREEESPVVKIQSQLLDGQEGSPDGDSEVDGLCQITVADNGIGFDEKYLDRIFDLFQRLHGHSNFEGSGMGLAVCRKIAKRHGGDITAKSKEGEGTTFIVKLPTKQTEGKDERWKNLQDQSHS